MLIGGTYVQPRIVKAIVDSQTGERKEVEVIKKDRVISEETAKNVLSMMESVVAEGTGKNAQVKGYRIGGKTGTSEDGVNTGKYVTSFIGVAPISDPQVAVLITLYNPTGEGGHHLWVTLLQSQKIKVYIFDKTLQTKGLQKINNLSQNKKMTKIRAKIG